MAENQVTTTFFANEEAAAAAIVRLEKKIEDLQNKMRHMHKESHDGAAHAAEGVRELGTMAVASAVGFTSLIGLVEKFGESAAEARKEAEAAAKAGEALEKRLAIQSGRFGVAGEKNIEAVSQAAYAGGRSREEVGGLFASLMRQGGLSPEQAQASIESQTKAYAATFEASGGQTTQAGYSRALKASLDKQQQATPEALASASRNLFAAMQGTGLSDEDVTATAHSFSTEGATPKRKKRVQDVMREMGMKLEDIDLQGENVFEATGRIAAGLQKLKPGRQEEVKEILFGDSQLGSRMLRAQGQMGGKGAIFDQSIEEVTTGRAAQGRRAALGKEMLLEQQANQDTLARDSAEIQALREGKGAFRRTVGLGGADAVIGFRRALGQNLDQGDVDQFYAGTSAAPGETAKVREGLKSGDGELKDLLRRGVEAQEKSNEHLEQIKDKAKGKPRRGGD